MSDRRSHDQEGAQRFDAPAQTAALRTHRWTSWDELETAGAEPLQARLLPLGQAALYRVRAPAGFSQRRHVHEQHLSVTWVQRGRIEYIVDSVTRELSPGEIIVVAPGLQHEWRVLEDFEGYECHLKQSAEASSTIA